MKTGNYMIDGDNGDDPRSPNYEPSATCPSCRRSVNLSRSFCRCGMPLDEMFDEEDFDEEEE